MTIEIGLLFTIITVGLGVLTYLSNKNKTTKDNTNKEIEEAVKAAKDSAKIETMLNTINQNISEMRLDSRETNKNIKSMSEKLTKLEQKVEMHDNVIHKLEEYHH